MTSNSSPTAPAERLLASARSRPIIVWFAVDIIIAAPTSGYAMWTEWRWVSLVIGGLLGAILGERYLRFRQPS